jgi:tRNA dimethylallyltransferase
VPARFVLTLNPPSALIGPTASGKESTALLVAERHGFEILSLDSMKLYRGMNLGTAKASPEARRLVPHHLVDLADPDSAFSTRDWLDAAALALEVIAQRGRRPLFSGGTALYLKALLYGIFDGPSAQPETRARLKALDPADLHQRLTEVDPVTAARVHPNDIRRVVRALEVFEVTGQPVSRLRRQWSGDDPVRPCRIAGIRRDRADLYRRIDIRVDRMMDAGLEDEVKTLLAAPPGLGPVARQALGYKEIADYLEGTIPTLDEAVILLKRRTRLFARRQLTWFKHFDVAWVDAGRRESAESIADGVSRALGL